MTMATRFQCSRRLKLSPRNLSRTISSITLASLLLAPFPGTWADTKASNKAVHYRLESIAIAKQLIEAESTLDEISLLLYLPLADRPEAAKVIHRIGLDPNVFLEKYVLPFSEGYSDGTHVILASETLEGIGEASLAFVLAHEWGHNELRSQLLKSAKAHEIGLATCPPLCKLNDTELIDSGFAQTNLWPEQFFWQAEFDADRLALIRLRKAGFKEPPRALLEGIPAIKKAIDAGAPYAGLTVTHPPFDDRIRAMEAVDHQITTAAREK